jgi:sugar phosphate isomerase/epimerase
MSHMGNHGIIPAALALDGIGGDARAGIAVAAGCGYRGIAFATNHPELTPDNLGESARRHLKSMLGGQGLSIESLRAAAPRGGLSDPATIDRTIENARKAMVLARELGVGTVALNIGALAAPAAGSGDAGRTENRTPEDTIVAALRELAQRADAAGLTLVVGAEGSEALGGILKRVDFDRARMNLDGARLIGAAEDPLVVAQRLAGTIGQLTASDAVRSGRSVRASMLGEGQLPLVELLANLREQGFDGPLVVDVRDLPDGVTGAEHAAAVLRRLLVR